MLSYFFGKGEEKKVENADPEKAMQEALNAHGDFTMNENGTLKFEDLCKLRAVIIRQANRAFKPIRDELNEKKIKAYNEDNKNYMELFIEGQQAYQKYVADWTKKSCEWIELDITDYQSTMKFIVENDQEQGKKLQELDMEVRAAIEHREITDTKETFIKAFKLKLQRDFTMAKILATIQARSSQDQMNLVSTVETAKTSDAMQDKFGFDLSHLMTGVKHFDLENSEEMAKFAQLIQMQQQTEMKKILELITPNQEDRNSMTVEAINLGKPELKADETMTFDYFIETCKIQQKYITRFTEQGLIERATERRQLLKDDKQAEFQQRCQEAAEWERRVQLRIRELFFTAKGIDMTQQQVDASLQLYMMDPEKRATYEEEMQKVRYEVQTMNKELLSREDVLKSVKLMEVAKFEAQQKMYELVRRQRLAPDAVNQIIKFEEIKAGDLFFNETGIEESQVEPSLEALKMKEDPEFTDIIKEFEKKSAEYLTAKKLETEEMVKKSQEVMTKVEEQAKQKKKSQLEVKEEKKAEEKE